MKVSLILTAYKNADLLRRCLATYSRINPLPDEIIIAEDSDDFDLNDLLRDCRPSKISYKHVQQADEGYRRSKILNKAIHLAKGELIITSDCDCIPHKRFIGDHVKYARSNHYTLGPRAYVEERSVADFNTSFFHRIKLSLKKDLYPKKVAFRLPWKNWNSNYYPIGANLAFWKEDCIRVNGFNESFEGWGYEDLDLMTRLKHVGVREQKLHQRCIVYHLNHPVLPRDQSETNELAHLKAVKEEHTSCELGIDQYKELSHTSLLVADCVF